MNTDKAAEAAKKLPPHNLELSEHKLLAVTGVKAVPTFSDKLITVQLDGEILTVGGHDLAVKKLDLESGVLAVSGYVTSMKYSAAMAPSSFFKKLLK